MEKVKVARESAGLCLNSKKTKVMTNTILQEFKLGNEDIEVVEELSVPGFHI